MPNLPQTPTLANIQTYVAAMEKERGFDTNTVTQKCLLLGEEVGELFKAIRKSHGAMRLDSPDYDANPHDELADILILMAAIANRLDISLEQAFRDKETKNHKRTWH